jgi:hypothetical protein
VKISSSVKTITFFDRLTLMNRKMDRVNPCSDGERGKESAEAETFFHAVVPERITK